jgi:hypothetical protein
VGAKATAIAARAAKPRLARRSVTRCRPRGLARSRESKREPDERGSGLLPHVADTNGRLRLALRTVTRSAMW